MTDAQDIREACNAENNPELPEGCMYPWCVCNRYPEGSMTRIETPDKDVSLLREALEDALRMPTNAEIMLAAGEFTTAQELRSAKAVLAWRLRVIRAVLSATAPKP